MISCKKGVPVANAAAAVIQLSTATSRAPDSGSSKPASLRWLTAASAFRSASNASLAFPTNSARRTSAFARANGSDFGSAAIRNSCSDSLSRSAARSRSTAPLRVRQSFAFSGSSAASNHVAACANQTRASSYLPSSTKPFGERESALPHSIVGVWPSRILDVGLVKHRAVFADHSFQLRRTLEINDSYAAPRHRRQ